MGFCAVLIDSVVKLKCVCARSWFLYQYFTRTSTYRHIGYWTSVRSQSMPASSFAPCARVIACLTRVDATGHAATTRRDGRVLAARASEAVSAIGEMRRGGRRLAAKCGPSELRASSRPFPPFAFAEAIAVPGDDVESYFCAAGCLRVASSHDFL